MKELQKFREDISAALSKQIPGFIGQLPEFDGISTSLENRLSSYALRGKLIRGSLIPFIYERCGGSISGFQNIIDIAAAIELFQSMLLIHDDIMDNDVLRRGKPAMHSLYTDDGVHGGYRDANHFGLSMGICAGDVAAFMAFGIISEMEIETSLLKEIFSFISKEMMLVGTAQMKDVLHGYLAPREVSFEQILSTYTYKTGRYTFSMPMSLGARLAAADSHIFSELETLGELLGVIFQIADDRIGLFGNEKTSGKTQGSDLAEGKKTVYTQKLFRELNSVDSVTLERILVDYEGANDLDWVHRKMKNHNISEAMDSYVNSLAEKCRTHIVALRKFSAELAGDLESLLEYNLQRNY